MFDCLLLFFGFAEPDDVDTGFVVKEVLFFLVGHR